MREGVVPPGDKTSSRLEDRTFVFDDEQFVREDPWKVFDIEIAASSLSLSRDLRSPVEIYEGIIDVRT